MWSASTTIIVSNHPANSNSKLQLNVLDVVHKLGFSNNFTTLRTDHLYLPCSHELPRRIALIKGNVL